MSKFEKDYFEKILLPSLKVVPLNYDAAIISILEQAGLGLQKISLLDYGCGDASFVKYMIGKGVDAWGVDISSYSKKVSVVPNRHEVLSGGAIPEGFGRKHYALCFCSGVLQYMEEAEIKNCLKSLGAICEKIWIETLTDCSNEIPAINDLHNQPLRTRAWYNKIFAISGFKVTRVTPVYYRNAWLLEPFKK
jgi:hypothetical protein